MLTLADSVTYVKGNFNEIYPRTEPRNKTLANLPERLHADLLGYAEERNLKMYEVLGGMWDFIQQYEEAYAAELKAHRKTPAKR